MGERDIAGFAAMLAGFREKYRKDASKAAVLDYLEKHYFSSQDRLSEWALCYRPSDMLTTNGQNVQSFV